MITDKWFECVGINTAALDRDPISLPVQLTRGSDIDDFHSIKLWTTLKGNAATQQIKAFIFDLALLYPLKIVSIYRPTGTHRFGAVDIAPGIDDSSYAHNRGVDPRLYARPNVLRNLLAILKKYQLITVLVEDNHFHIQAKDNPGVPQSFPSASLLLQIRPRKGYQRTNYDISSDQFFQSSLYWVPIEESVINSLPKFNDRF